MILIGSKEKTNILRYKNKLNVNPASCSVKNEYFMPLKAYTFYKIIFYFENMIFWFEISRRVLYLLFVLAGL